VRDDRLYALWILVATTGMRRAELAGLRWSDIDFTRARLTPRLPRVAVNYLGQDVVPGMLARFIPLLFEHVFV
jgi:integrase